MRRHYRNRRGTVSGAIVVFVNDMSRNRTPAIFFGSAPSAESVNAFAKAGGRDRPRVGQLTVCWAKTEDEAVRTAHEM